MPLVPDGIDLEQMAQYFKDNDVEDFLVDMLLALAKSKPVDPEEFMIDFIRERRMKRKSTDTEEEEDDDDVDVEEMPPPPMERFNKQRMSVDLQSESDTVRNFVAEWVDENDEVLGPQKLKRLGTAKLNFARRSTDDGEVTVRAREVLDWNYDFLAQDARKTVPIAQSLLEDYVDCDKLGVDKKRLDTWVELVHENYIAENPFHHWVHGFHVMTVVITLLSEGGDVFTTPLTHFAALIGALSHDVGHPGFNNDYLVKSKNALAIRYNDNAVLENMHAALAFELMLGEEVEANFLHAMPTDDFAVVRKTVISVILATDMKVHFDIVSQLQAFASAKGDADEDKSKDLVLRVIVHAADLSNPVLPTERARDWAYRAVLEFHNQAELEKKEGLPFAPFMEPHPDNVLELAKLQIGFVSFVVKPYWLALTQILPRLQHRVDQLEENLVYWNKTKEVALAKAEADKP
mmetsp:Transcript_9779/g.23320  ORF Transcript_9779/g.23320 Transcript_9779/m.23320 type:complete len:462 (-) Transcript_9779:166-1551(-)